MSHHVSQQTLQEMRTCYNERAREYDEWFYRKGRYDRGLDLIFESMGKGFRRSLPSLVLQNKGWKVVQTVMAKTL